MNASTPDPERDRRFMRMALDACRRGVEHGQTPFGACIVDTHGQVLAAEHNTVWRDIDPTSHAEVHAIRIACRSQGKIHLPKATIYSTTEPCPMCFSAIHWARIERIVYAATVEDAMRFGFQELQISNATMKQVSGSAIEVVPDVMRAEALELYRQWQAGKGEAY